MIKISKLVLLLKKITVVVHETQIQVSITLGLFRPSSD